MDLMLQETGQGPGGEFYLGWCRCCGQTERTVVMLAVLLVEVETHQAGVIVVSVPGLVLRVHGTKTSEGLHFRLVVRFHLKKK